MATAEYDSACLEALDDKVATLPTKFQLAWESGCSRRVILPHEAVQRHGFAGFKPPRPPGLWAPATALMVVTYVSGLQKAAERAALPDEPDELFRRQTLVALLKGPLSHLSGASKILHVRAAKTFSEQIMRRPTDGLVSLQLRIRANETARDYSGVLKDYAHYRTAALGLEPHMEKDEPHDVTSAVMCREKAVACLAVSIDPRLGELSGLSKTDVVVDGDEVAIVIRAANSKERVTQSRALDTECANAFLEYFHRGRAYLCDGRTPNTPEPVALWIAYDGKALGQPAVSQALTKVLAKAAGAPAGAKILRKVMATREDLADREVSAALGHALHSVIGIDVYGLRDVRNARRQLVALLESQDQ